MTGFGEINTDDDSGDNKNEDIKYNQDKNTNSGIEVLNSSLEEIRIDNNYNPVLSNDKIDYKVGFIMMCLTIALLFPYQSFLSSLDYFEVMYPNYHSSSTIIFTYMFLLTVSFIFVVKYSNKLRHHYNIISGFIVFVIVMIIIPLLNLTSIGGSSTSYIITLILMAIASFFDGIIQSSIYALAGLFSPKYSIICQIGTGLSGVIVIIIRIIIKLIFNNSNDENKAGFIVFYSVGGLSVIIACLLFIYLLKSPLGKIIMKDNNNIDDNNNNNNINQNIEINKLNSSQDSIDSIQSDEVQIKSPVKYVFSIVYTYLIPTFFIYLISLFLFPSIILEIPVKRIDKSWYTIVVVAIFNLFDFIGKIFPYFLKIKLYNIYMIWVVSFSRVIFIFLIFMSIYVNSFRVDGLVYIYLMIFGFTNGFISSVVMADVPQKVQRKYKELSAILVTFSIILGLFFGAALNLLVTLLVF